MRDPNRIPWLINKLFILWREHPDLRLGQIIHIAAGNAGHYVFGIEDDKLEDGLEDLYEKLSTGTNNFERDRLKLMIRKKHL